MIGFENFVRYLKGFYLRNVPEVMAPALAAGRPGLLDGAPNMRHKALIQQRLEQNMPYTGGCRPGRDIFVGVAGNENHGCGDVAGSQPAREVDAVHVGHLVVDHKAVDAGRTHGVQQRRAVAEGPDLEPVDYQKESQRTEHAGVVVHHIDSRFGWRAGLDHDPDWLTRRMTGWLDLAQSLRSPARIASRTSSERLLACILVITLAR